jgi:hypothetical protein
MKRNQFTIGGTLQQLLRLTIIFQIKTELPVRPKIKNTLLLSIK